MENDNVRVMEAEAKRSFSFSCSNDDRRKSESYGDCESYIEIELEPIRLGGEDDKLTAEEDELDLRISFSSAVAFPDVSMDESFEKAARSPLFSSSLSEWSFSSAETSNSWSAPLPCQKQRTFEWRVRAPAMNRLVGTFLSSSGKLSEIGEKSGRQIDASKEMPIRKGSCNNSNIASRRRQGGVMMKIWMKLRAKNLRALLESFLKPPQLNSEGGFSKKKRVAEGFDKCLVQKESRRNKPDGGRGLGERRAKSCPVSSKASPLHPREREAKVFGGECSIQAAIAHCKRSYAEPSDFRF